MRIQTVKDSVVAWSGSFDEGARAGAPVAVASAPSELVALVEELRHDIPSVPDRIDPVAQVMTEPLDPHAVIHALEHPANPSAKKR